MTFAQKLLILALLSGAAALGVAIRLPRNAARPAAGSWVVGWLALVCGALLIVGIVSHTLARHLIQISPLLIALGLGIYRPGFRAVAALPLFTFWLILMGGIWLSLLGIAQVFTGRWSVVEIVLTIVIGAASTAGLVAASREGTSLSLSLRFAVILSFAVLQPVAMLLSF